MSKTFTNIIRLPDVDSGLHLSIVRFYNGHIDSKKANRNKFFRLEALTIKNTHNGMKILRYAMGNSSLPINKNTIAIDYDAIDALGLKYKTPCVLQVTKATTFEVYQWFWRHPDLIVRTSIKLGLLGAALGVLGFVSGIT